MAIFPQTAQFAFFSALWLSLAFTEDVLGIKGARRHVPTAIFLAALVCVQKNNIIDELHDR